MEKSLFEGAFDAPALEPPIEEKLSDDTVSLLFVGYLTDTVMIGNHQIRIRTLKVGEELTAALVANKYKDTIEEGRALATALVAASIVTVDGAPIGDVLGPHESKIEAKFDYLLENWYWDTINKVWTAYNELLVKVREGTENLKKV